jgi:hypothetical protein
MAHFMCISIMAFYLNTPMDRPAYMRVTMGSIQKKMESMKGIYGITHSG